MASRKTPDRAVTTGVRTSYLGDTVKVMGIIQNMEHGERHSNVIVISLDKCRRTFRQFSRPEQLAALRMIEQMFHEVEEDRPLLAPIPKGLPEVVEPVVIPVGKMLCPRCSGAGTERELPCPHCDGDGVVSANC